MSDLFNLLVAGLHKPKRAFDDPYIREIQDKYLKADASMLRRDLLGAQKFILRDSMHKHIVTASMMPPKKLWEMFSEAIPPFENMWIETNASDLARTQVQIINEIGILPDDAKVDEHVLDGVNDLKVGFHITKRSDFDFYFINQYHLAPDGFLKANPLSFAFDPQSPIDHSLLVRRDEKTGEIVDQSLEAMRESQLALSAITFFGDPYCIHHGWYDDETGEPKRDPWHLRFNEHIVFCPDLYFGKHAFNRHSLGFYPERVAEAQRQSLDAWKYGPVLMIATLGLINYTHTIIERDTESTEARRIAWGRPVPRNELRTVELDLPKPRGTTQYEKIFSGCGRKKRRHYRRGHWRRKVHKNGLVTKRWIAEQWVGDASLGTILHDYDLKGKTKH